MYGMVCGILTCRERTHTADGEVWRRSSLAVSVDVILGPSYFVA